MKVYQEIERLKQYLAHFSIEIKKKNHKDNTRDLFWVNLTINNHSWDIFIDDEFLHFGMDKPILNLYLTLSALQLYDECEDFLEWTREYGLKGNTIFWLYYYKSLATIYAEVEKVLGEVNPQVSYFDYNMKTSLGMALIKAK